MDSRLVPWEVQYSNIDEASKEQKDSLELVKKSINAGQYIDVGSSDSYLYQYNNYLTSLLFYTGIKDDEQIEALKPFQRKTKMGLVEDYQLILDRIKAYLSLYEEAYPKPLYYMHMLYFFVGLYAGMKKELQRELIQYIEFLKDVDINAANRDLAFLYINYFPFYYQVNTIL